MTPEIEEVFAHGSERINRFPVPGGWLYEWRTGEATGRTVTFVPKVPYGADADHHVCDHGFAAWTCGACEDVRRRS